MVANGTTNGTQTYSNRQSEALGLSHTEWIEIQVSVCSLTISSKGWLSPARRERVWVLWENKAMARERGELVPIGEVGQGQRQQHRSSLPVQGSPRVEED